MDPEINAELDRLERAYHAGYAAGRAWDLNAYLAACRPRGALIAYLLLLLFGWAMGVATMLLSR